MVSKFARTNDANRSSIDTTTVWNEGSFKLVYTGTYINGRREGEPCVCKMMKGGDPYLETAFDLELSIIAKAQEIINQFNEGGFIDKDIYLNDAEVWSFVPDSSPKFANKKNMVEPMIANFEKFNSNTGWVSSGDATWCAVMQALSHFSYHISGGDYLLCDLQAVSYTHLTLPTTPYV